MKLRLDGYVLHLGRLRRDGRRNVERVRLTSWRPLLPALRRAKVSAKMDGHRLSVSLPDDHQLLLPFSESA